LQHCCCQGATGCSRRGWARQAACPGRGRGAGRCRGSNEREREAIISDSQTDVRAFALRMAKTVGKGGEGSNLNGRIRFPQPHRRHTSLWSMEQLSWCLMSLKVESQISLTHSLSQARMQASNAHTHAHMHTPAQIRAQTLNPTESLFLGQGLFHSCSLKLSHSHEHKREVR
jgi:hypothetical protein